MRALGIHNTNGFGVKSERDIHQAGEWDIVVLKGNAFPGNEGEKIWNANLPVYLLWTACCHVHIVVMHHKLVRYGYSIILNTHR